MPSVGRFLDILEAISRKDWSSIENVVKTVAMEERKKKHYQVAHQIEQALDVVMSTAQLSDTIGTVSSPITSLNAQPPNLLYEVELSNITKPFFSSETEATVKEFLGEWQKESSLAKKGLGPRKTFLLYGPPGCGKTHLASFIAKELRMRMFLVRFDTLISSYLGETASNLKTVFQFASSNRCVLLLDELDAIGKLRDDKNELGELKRVVISLLQNIDLNKGRSILIGATNHPHMLDPAIWRRFEVVLEVTYPGNDERVKILEEKLGITVHTNIRKSLVESTNEFSGSDLDQISKNAMRKMLIDEGSNIVEYLFVSILDALKRPSPNEAKRVDPRKLAAATALKQLDSKKFSFKTLEGLSGVPHSTLHSKIAEA